MKNQTARLHSSRMIERRGFCRIACMARLAREPFCKVRRFDRVRNGVFVDPKSIETPMENPTEASEIQKSV